MAAYTTLPGGAKLTFHGYLPARTCLKCRYRWPAADYVKAIYVQNQRRFIKFGERCLRCDPPPRLPRELNGVRPTTTYKDDNGILVGWRQRTRVGEFGPPLPLETMGLRQLADGVWRPQPKLDRRSEEQQHAQPKTPKRYRDLCDQRRSYSRAEVRAAEVAQHWLCRACGKPFTETDPAVGGHDLPYADGWPTDAMNCVALHRSCNAAMGRQSVKQYRHENKRFQLLAEKLNVPKNPGRA